MKKIGIITINDYNNYGNRLQNYAAQEVLTSLGFSVETILNKPIEPENHHTKSPNGMMDHAHRIRKMTFHEIARKSYFRLWKYINRKKIREYKERRVHTFKKFTHDHIRETRFCVTDQYIPYDLLKDYDYFITGSDQVWNPAFRYGSSVDFLTFAPKHKRIAFSPSFGISEIPGEYVEAYKQRLSEFPHLSVREEAGAKIIQALTGRKAEVLVDPTLLLTKEKWLSIAKPSVRKPGENYLLTYFLGRVPTDYQEWIHRVAKEHDLDIINLADIKDLETYITGPSEFIDFIRSASVFCTDSFHGVVFSLLMETPFVVFDRKGHMPSMNSRIETVLSTFRLESRHIRNIKQEDILAADYSHTIPILENERNKALNYLKNALQINHSKPKEVVSG